MYHLLFLILGVEIRFLVQIGFGLRLDFSSKNLNLV